MRSLDPDQRELVRLSAVGSVDDGKSTLIGRLLYDTGSVPRDQLEQVARAGRLLADGEPDLALITDGLRSEREQGITIDVAYRYFSTDRRRFIIADTPGHEQYTRNMVTGASTADIALILVDASRGITTQSRRHGVIASLLQVRHLVVCVNKMDRVDWSQERFEELADAYGEFARKLSVHDLTFVPLCALHGDNVVHRSTRMPWYAGTTLLHYLERVTVSTDRNLIDFRFPVQYVVRQAEDGRVGRVLTGRVASGTIRRGEDVVVLPRGQRTRVAAISCGRRPCDEAVVGQSVAITLDDELDAGRGDMLARPGNRPAATRSFDAMLVWMDEYSRLSTDRSYELLHTTRRCSARVVSIAYRLNVGSLHREPCESLSFNELGRVTVETREPLMPDPYRLNRATGGFILVDPRTRRTVAAGMVREAHASRSEPALDRNATGAAYPARIVWFTGLSGAGKSTIADALSAALQSEGHAVARLDGDVLRQGLCSDLGFSREDRRENLRRAGHVAQLMYRAGMVVLCSFVSPFREDRERVRQLVPPEGFLEVHVRVSLAEARRRDPKGLYRRADAGELADLTGVGQAYEAPQHPDLTIDTETISVDEAVEQLRTLLASRGR